MPGQGKDAERFAAWVERGRPPRSADAELARELEIAARLREAGPSMDPTAEEKARARRRLMARLAAEGAGHPGVPAEPSSTMRPTLPITDDHERVTPRRRVSTFRDESATEVTARIDPVPPVDTEHDDYGDARYDGPYGTVDEREYDGTGVSGHVVTGARRGRREGRHTIPSRPGRFGGSSRPGSTKHSAVKRALVTSSAALLAIIALSGAGMFASRNALPGESLYGIKRVAESAGTALTFDDAAKAARNLELASTRLGEVQQLTQQQSTPVDPQLVQQAIAEFDSSADAGSSFILTEDEAHDPAKLAELRGWAIDQAKKLTALKPLLPASSQADADKSVALLRKLAARAAALQQRNGCDSVTSGRSDGIGPIPAQGSCTQSTDGDEASSESDPSTSAGRSSGSGATSGDTTSGPSSSAPSTTSTDGGLLGGLLGTPSTTGSAPSSASDPTSESGRSSSTTTTTTTKAPVNIPLPLPVPITIPPLLPGGSGITIG
jgi:hypothetical protein